jgi:LPXTG-motif cell wall-anchored protein
MDYYWERSAMRDKMFFFFFLFFLLPVVSLFTGVFLYDLSFASGAKGNLVINGSEKYGLRVDHSDNPFVFENLFPGYPCCPGDEGEELTTVVKISNTGKEKFKLLIEKRVLSDDAGDLMLYAYEGLRMDVFECDDVDKKLFSGPLKELKKIEAGNVFPGARAREFEFSISLDENAGNELQGKSIDLEWIFTATGDTGGSGPSGPRVSFDPPSSPPSKAKKDSPEDEGEDEIIMPPDEPGQPPEEKTGHSVPELPKTGEFPPAFYYGIGLFMILAGILLKKYYVRDKFLG